MIRLICFEADAGMAANVGGPVRITRKTFDIEAPEMEAWLREEGSYINRGFEGIEVLP
jgi:hypothetical protein